LKSCFHPPDCADEGNAVRANTKRMKAVRTIATSPYAGFESSLGSDGAL
jgi:hypothetical protein